YYAVSQVRLSTRWLGSRIAIQACIPPQAAGFRVVNNTLPDRGGYIGGVCVRVGSHVGAIGRCDHPERLEPHHPDDLLLRFRRGLPDLFAPNPERPSPNPMRMAADSIDRSDGIIRRAQRLPAQGAESQEVDYVVQRTLRHAAQGISIENEEGDVLRQQEWKQRHDPQVARLGGRG